MNVSTMGKNGIERGQNPRLNFLFFLKKGLDKWLHLCYTIITKGKEIPNTRKEKLMFDNSFIVENEIALDFYVVAPNGELVEWDA